VFVVQQHAARRMHWDFRLEADGVLKSWPLPKGPSLDPSVKRLAVMTEDHPFEYRNFEGVIPKGEYGGGQVIIWDEGTYSPDEGAACSWGNKEEANARMREGLEKGKLSFTLRGHKLHGSFTLIRTKQRRLFIKDGRVELRSRRGLDCTRQYPSVAKALEAQTHQPVVLDGEVCALDENGVPRFQLLQPRMNLSRTADIAQAEATIPVVFYVFDILYADGADLRPLPL